MPRISPPSVRLRLTLLYGALFLVAAAVLLALNYFLVRRRISIAPEEVRERIEARLGRPLFPVIPAGTMPRPNEGLFTETVRQLRAETLHQLLVQSIIALSVMVVASMTLGWVVAGRVLSPLKRITGTARRLSLSSLHERIALQGPKDELKELADTFDDMLSRLEAAFESQKRFVANASHELKTPLSIIRAELDVTLSNHDATPAELEGMAEVVRAATDRSERLIGRLLLLARSESGPPDRQQLDLVEIVRQVLAQLSSAAEVKRLAIRENLSAAQVGGDPTLLERLVGNLIENAIVHNVVGGWIEVSTDRNQDVAQFRVSNSGPLVPASSIEELFRPFRRLVPDRTGSATGVGLGLSIVEAVARAHGGGVSARPGSEGGLDVVVRLPATSDQTVPIGSVHEHKGRS